MLFTTAEFAVRDNIIIRNVDNYTIRPKVRAKEMKALNNDKIKKFVQTVKEYQDLPSTRTKNVYPALMLALATGCRRGEILGLKWENVNLQNKTIKIEETVLEIGGDVITETPIISFVNITVYGINQRISNILGSKNKKAAKKNI